MSAAAISPPDGALSLLDAYRPAVALTVDAQEDILICLEVLWARDDLVAVEELCELTATDRFAVDLSVAVLGALGLAERRYAHPFAFRPVAVGAVRDAARVRAVQILDPDRLRVRRPDADLLDAAQRLIQAAWSGRAAKVTAAQRQRLSAAHPWLDDEPDGLDGWAARIAGQAGAPIEL